MEEVSEFDFFKESDEKTTINEEKINFKNEKPVKPKVTEKINKETKIKIPTGKVELIPNFGMYITAKDLLEQSGEETSYFLIGEKRLAVKNDAETKKNFVKDYYYPQRIRESTYYGNEISTLYKDSDFIKKWKKPGETPGAFIGLYLVYNENAPRKLFDGIQDYFKTYFSCHTDCEVVDDNFVGKIIYIGGNLKYYLPCILKDLTYCANLKQITLPLILKIMQYKNFETIYCDCLSLTGKEDTDGQGGFMDSGFLIKYFYKNIGSKCRAIHRAIIEENKRRLNPDNNKN